MEVARIRPGSMPQILASYPAGDGGRWRVPLAASPNGKWIVARSSVAGPMQLFLVTPDFAHERAPPLTRTAVGAIAAGFSKDARDVMSIHRNTSVDGVPWELWAIDVASGRERLLTRIDLPQSTEQVIGFSLHPDGTRFLTSAYSNPSDIWMLEGFDRR